MYHEKRYLQFNDLVLDGYDMISQSDESTAFKVTTQPYSYGHGSYAPLKDKMLFVSEGSVTMTIKLFTKKIPCEYREYYVRFAEQELSKQGKLWAIKNNEIIWAYAIPKNLHQVKLRKPNRVEYDVEFVLPEGLWHKADKQKTFVLPYNVCTFMECKGYRTLDPCGDCCDSCQDNKWQKDMDERCFCCCVDEITANMALCYHLKELQKFHTCETPFQLVYDCQSAEKFNKYDYLGQRLCVEDICESNSIAGRFYSETDLATRDVSLVIVGHMTNPWITINGNTNIIRGTYNGALIVDKSGDIYYQKGECCDPKLLSPTLNGSPRWSIPCGNDYGWTIYPQFNSIKIDFNRCCQGASCVYIQHDAITT